MGKRKIHEHQAIIRFRAKDGFEITSLLVTEDDLKKKYLLEVPILIQIHGVLGHFLARGTPRLLPHALLEYKYSSLSVNTRLAFAGQITGKGIFDDTVHDIDAAVEFVTQAGFKNIFILGYSLGASMLVYWASQRRHKNVRGLILEGLHYSIPEWWKKNFNKFKSAPSYEEVYKKAKSILGEDPYNSLEDESLVVYHSRGPTREPKCSEVFTYKTWWFMAGPEAHKAMAYKHIAGVKTPMLMIRGENDPLVEDWEPGALEEVAKKAGNKDIMIRILPDAKHDCMENDKEFLKEIVAMFKKYTK